MADALPAGATLVEPIAAAEIRPRFELYITGEDHLRIQAVNSLAGVVLTIAGRAWDPVAGVIVPIGRTLAPPADRTMAELTIPLAAGFLLDLTVFASTGAPVSGQTYVMAHLVRGLTSNAPQLATLTADYVTSLQCLCWPGSAPKSSTEGEPYVRAVTGTLPAAGVDFLETVPTGARWEFLTLRVAFVTSAAAGNRETRLRLSSGGQTYGDFVSPAGVPPLTSQGITFAQNVPSVSSAAAATMQAGVVSPMILPSGMRFGSVTTNFDAADQWQTPYYVVREWLEVP